MDYFINCGFIDLNTTFNCGQCFRWSALSDTLYGGVCGKKYIEVKQEKTGLTLLNIKKEDIPYWENYFCADEDYSTFVERFSEDSVLKEACAYAPGLRVLRQDAYETLMSFIISQNNNIGRIRGIIKRLCAKSEDGSFASPEDIIGLGEVGLKSIGAGYRAKYLTDAAKKVHSGEINLDKIQKMDYNVAKGELLKIVGVGEKVADCVLLFGFHKTEAFPKDVWIKRVLVKYYPDGLPDCTKGYEGIAQQFLFHYIRNSK
ncbi:MAG: DNA-3-methyladenine glycosylase 2 [Oscillospiraceae bacterium]|nr:DNA-3-methyladenine glycosylase 2 [Oscillospiraceae bacterium]